MRASSFAQVHAFVHSPAQVGLEDLQNGRIVLPIQINAPGLIRSVGRLRQQSMQARFSVSHAPNQNQEGIHALVKAEQVTFCKAEQATRKKTAGRNQRFFK